MLNSRKRCVAVNCPGTASQIHRFPKDFVRCQIWAERAGCLHLLEKGSEHMNVNYRLCSDHFNEKSYTSTERKRLTNYALPEIFSHIPEGSYKSISVNIETRCRTCASVSEDLIPVFGDKGVTLQLVQKIHTHLPILVTAEDKLPAAICSSCADKLEMCNQFVRSSLQADEILKSLLRLKTTDEQIKVNENVQPTDSEVTIKREPVDHGVKSDESIPAVQQCGSESKMVSVNPKFKVVVMKMNVRNLNSNAQMEKAINVLKNLDNIPAPSLPSEVVEQQVVEPPEETELSGLETSDIEIPDDLTACLLNESSSTSLPILSNEDTKSIDIKPDICEDTISSSFIEINKNPSSKTPDQLVYSCLYCKMTIIGKEELAVHKKISHPDKVFCCPDCDVVIYESREIFEEHIKIHLNGQSCVSISDIKWRQTDMNKGCELPSIDIGLLSGNSEFEISETNFNSGTGTELSCEFMPSQQEVDALEIVSVADVHVEPEKQFEMEGKPQGNSKLKMKISKDFEKIEDKLKSKIIGAIKGIIKTSENNVENDECNKTEELSDGSKKKLNSTQWKCRKCKHVSLSWGEHIQHLRKHPTKTYQCIYCDKIFGSKSAFGSHESVHTQEKRFMCEYCGNKFRSNQTLKNHLHVHGAGDRKYECKECSKTFGTKAGYESHCSSHGKGSYLCDICGKVIKHLKTLRLHRLSHVDPTYFIRHGCMVCGKTYQNRYFLKDHMNIHRNLRPYKCPHCTKNFHKRCQLSQHIKIHLNALQHKCPICGRGFNHMGNMKVHVRRHQRTNCYTCRLCKSTFTTVGRLISHRKSQQHKESKQTIKQDTNGNEHVCNICGKKLSSKLTLKSHTMTHSDAKPFSCDVCGKKFAVKGNLRLHYNLHNSEKSFRCHYCDEAFHTKQLKIIHERIHTGEKPFQCTDCDKAFRSRMSLNQHVVVHSDARPFKCSHCDKSFRRRDTLDTHLRIHSGERPYSCHICSRSFKQKGDCNKHLKTHLKSRKIDVEDSLNNITFSCILCEQNFSQKDDLDVHFETFHAADVIIASNTLTINSNTLITLNGITEDDEKHILSDFESCLKTT